MLGRMPTAFVPHVGHDHPAEYVVRFGALAMLPARGRMVDPTCRSGLKLAPGPRFSGPAWGIVVEVEAGDRAEIST